MNVNSEGKKIIVELLSLCNLNCKHCFYRSTNKYHSPDVMSFENFKRVVDICNEKSFDKMVLTGGEPTLHPLFVDISKYALKKIPKVSVCTNGVLRSLAYEDLIISLGFSGFTVSIDSYKDAVHDEFRGRVGALKSSVGFLDKLQSKNEKISIHITVHPGNYRHIAETIEFCQKWTNDIMVGSIYSDKLANRFSDRNYLDEVKNIKLRYMYDPSVTLVGFEESCTNPDCLDKRNVFTLSRKCELLDCYWKEGGGATYGSFFSYFK